MLTIVITGASDGIGAAAAARLSAQGHNVILAGRSPAKTEAVARRLGLPFHIADFARLDDVARLASALGSLPRIDVLANNAGGIMGRRSVTADGFERTFQVNHLAPFLLTRLLLGKLAESRAKVIQTSSMAANIFGKGFDIGDLQNTRDYRPAKAYGYGKLENILFTRELDRRHRADGISAVAFHPGVVRTAFARDTTHVMRLLYHSPLKYLFTISPETSANRLVALVQGRPGTDWQRGEVYDKSHPMRVDFQDPDGTAARRLWTESETLLRPWL
ncbi:SDR family NAD(P)-dependent oxidoreductase [Paragemmobacter straminiformis]|uniref:SDR family NAD(P)-dependent oxidoreductase n=1 Tax=Paragemmobacter straminiformis TaxID=2045119 RepID=A0A842IAE5_9RHOB|nr:SDR family NAD(P)-dependent oxidoreductase [Gemmobacter straminiformis]MBC2836830.1 SDR family NAD(P)-dependent oxidoreductase [Gemmobacter straminiformis]